MFGKKPSKTPAADMALPSKEELEALAKASGVSVAEIAKDAPKDVAAQLSTDFEHEEPTHAGVTPKPVAAVDGACPVCGLVTREATCPIDGSKLKG